MTDDKSLRLHLIGEAAQEGLGRRMAEHLRAPCVIHLIGDLGTGKTTLVRGILRGLGLRGAARSPTFTLLEPYELAGMALYHLDLYRLADPEELEYLGLRDLLERDSVLLVEWPERGGEVLPPADVEIRLRYAGEARGVTFSALSPRGGRLVEALAGHSGSRS